MKSKDFDKNLCMCPSTSAYISNNLADNPECSPCTLGIQDPLNPTKCFLFEQPKSSVKVF